MDYAEGELLLEVRNLKTYFRTSDGLLPAVDGVTFHVNAGETLGIVGESGCGKSVTSLSIMRLIPVPPGQFAGGEVLFAGKDLLKATDQEIQRIRGNDIAMIFQEPMTSLNPVYTIGNQIAEAVQFHQGVSWRESMNRAKHTLELVGIPDPARRLGEYPHQLSGGLRQRAMIAMALSCNPKLLIADEPTTALDVTIQAQILELMKRLKKELGMAIMLITHDLGVVAEMAQRVVVMYAGKVVEEASVKELFRRPLHPYSEGLFACIPRIDRPRGRLHVIEGIVPSLLDVVKGCKFATRCPYAQDRCRVEEPALEDRWGGRVACHFPPNERQESGKVAS